MGSPLAPLVVEVFMDAFEREIFDSGSGLILNIRYWHRYVDGVLCMWSGSISELHDFLNLLNSKHSNIKFTIEVGGNTINFLDLSISRQDE